MIAWLWGRPQEIILAFIPTSLFVPCGIILQGQQQIWTNSFWRNILHTVWFYKKRCKISTSLGSYFSQKFDQFSFLNFSINLNYRFLFLTKILTAFLTSLKNKTNFRKMPEKVIVFFQNMLFLKEDLYGKEKFVFLNLEMGSVDLSVS